MNRYAILQNKTTTDIRVLAAKENFITMQEMGRNYLVEGIISYEEFERVLSVQGMNTGAVSFEYKGIAEGKYTVFTRLIYFVLGE